jgi:hypothetical protein
MKVDATGFGWIEVDGHRYPHDLLIYVDGAIENRYQDFHWTSHTLTREEVAKVTRGDPEVLVVGTGQYGILAPTPQAIEYLRAHKIRFITASTPEAIKEFNALKGKRCALFHVTC